MKNSAIRSLHLPYVEDPPFLPGSPLPYPEMYTYTEDTSLLYDRESFLIDNNLILSPKPILFLKEILQKIFKCIVIAIFFLQGILQCAFISIDVGLHALFYNANKISKEMPPLELEGKSLLEKIKLFFKFTMQRIILSARSYIIDHWILQKDATKDVIKERLNEPNASSQREHPIQGINTLFIENPEYSDYIFYIPGMRDSHQISNHHLHNMSKHLKANIVCPNPMGVGGSKGACTDKEDYYRASEIAFAHLKDRMEVSINKITVWGHSLGGSAAANIAKNHQVNVVFDRTFSSLYDATENFPYAPFPCNKLISKVASLALAVSTYESMDSIDPSRVLILSAKNDNVIDFDKASAKNLIGNFQRMFCTFTDIDTDSSDRLSLSHSAAHTPETLTKIKTLFIDKE